MAQGENDDHDDLHADEDDDEVIRIGDIVIPGPGKKLEQVSQGRLIITDIINENFKSYAGVQSLGPFHKSFTSIIGPNGSGKSNVIDSMLFVFGYRAQKIRSKKISVLLHSSKKFPNITSCTVAVHFIRIIDKDDDDDYEVIPGSELVIARTAMKDNSSFYTLNGRRVQFKEVAKVLRSHGIDLDHNRFLILQGEVEQIAMMKPKAQNEHDTGMLEYLEDIVGTSRYKEPLEKLSVRVEELTDARKEKLNRVRLVEAEKKKLEGPMREAMDRIDIMNNLARAKNTLLQKYIRVTDEKVEALNGDRSKRQSALDELDSKMKELKKFKKMKDDILAEGMKKFDNLERRKEESTEELKKMKHRDVALQADSSQATKRKKNIGNVLEQEKSKLIELEQVPEKSARDMKECEELKIKLSKQRETKEIELEKVMESIRAETEELQEAKDKVQNRLIDLRKIEDDAKRKFKLAESELNLYIGSEESEKRKLAESNEALEKATVDLREKKKRLSELQISVPSKEKQLERSKRELEKLKTEDMELNRKARTLRAHVEESKQSMNATKSKGRVLDSLLAEKKSGRIPGIYGRLGDLGAIDSKYDVAISTCCGPLDNIVVDTANTAQKCIEYLRDHNIGRATFILLEKQEHLRDYCNRSISTPENVSRLFDLIKVNDDTVRPAFYYALRDTLVAKDLDQATRISFGKQRYRVVTLGGDVIEIAGTMSGGGKTVRRGRMGQKMEASDDVDPRQIQNQERELSVLQERLKELGSIIPELENTVSSLSREVSQLKIEMSKLEVECKNLTEQIPLLKNQIKEQSQKASKSSVDPKQKSALDKATREAGMLLEKAKMNSDKVEAEVKEIHDKIVAAAGGKVKSLQKSIDEITTKIDKVDAEITRLNVAVKTSERNAKKSREKIGQMEKEIKELEEKLQLMNEEKKQLTIKGAELEEEMEKIDIELSEGKEEFKELKTEIDQLAKKENAFKAERLEIVNAISKVDKSIDELKSKIPSWKRELSSLTLEVIPIADREPPTPLATYTAEELDTYSADELVSKVSIQEERLGEQKPNLQAIQEYKAKEEIFLQRAAELEEITNKRNEMRDAYENIRRKRQTEFLTGFRTIGDKLKEMYQMITLGGDADLELVDSLDPFTEGVVFSVRPPNKSWKNISNLSGGEKTLSSLALVFALHYYKPSPLYVMDEIDAALDFKNVSIVANYIKERTKNAQFIIISLRYNMFELANKLVGIYKVQDCTQSVTIYNNTEFADGMKEVASSS